MRSNLPADTALAYARAGLDNIAREYPNHPAHVLTGPEDLVPPSELHPIFYGSFDWHSAVHQHWMLARILRLHPDIEVGGSIRAAFDARCTLDAARVEAHYLDTPERRSFERPYGWAWLATLHAELSTWGDPDGDRWAQALDPLAATVRDRCLDWLLGTHYPQRSGTHGNSAFAAGLLYDVAVAADDAPLIHAIEDAAARWYGADGASGPYAGWLEPSATDFLSPGLVEVDLLRRVEPDRFVDRLARFLPDPGPLAVPVEVADRTDPHGVHLDGLNLSRAWCWADLAEALPADHALRVTAIRAAEAHAASALPYVLTGEYVGEHWLATFAVYLLGGRAVTEPT